MATTATASQSKEEDVFDVDNEEIEEPPVFPLDALDETTKEQIFRCATRPPLRRGERLNVMQPFPQSVVDLFTTPFLSEQPNQPTSTLGVFDTLAVELQFMVLLQMNITTLISFSQTCRRARAVVQGLPEFRTVTEFAGTTLFMPVIATRLSDQFSIARLHDVLATWECKGCGVAFGEFVFLPYLERYCVDCLKFSTTVRKHCAIRSIRRVYRNEQPPPCLIRGYKDTRVTALVLAIFPTAHQHLYLVNSRGTVHCIRPDRPKTQWTVVNLGPPLITPEDQHMNSDYSSHERYRPWGVYDRKVYTRSKRAHWLYKPIPDEHLCQALSIAVPYMEDVRNKNVVTHGVRCAGPSCEEYGVWLPSDYIENHFPWCESAVELYTAQQKQDEAVTEG
ncbi:hypothetical protein V8F20_003434 [Naviculisporaceae sp. PSN 640]